jgi:hypothetical protein
MLSFPYSSSFKDRSVRRDRKSILKKKDERENIRER